MRRIFLLVAAANLVAGLPAAADNAAAVAIERLGLMGTWASYCTEPLDRTKPGLRIVFAVPPGGDPTYTKIWVEGGFTSSDLSTVLEAAPIDAAHIRLRLRTIGGTREGGGLLSPSKSIFERTIEKTDDGIRVVGGDPRFIAKCPD